jgi:hypothetical protein
MNADAKEVITGGHIVEALVRDLKQRVRTSVCGHLPKPRPISLENSHRRCVSHLSDKVHWANGWESSAFNTNLFTTVNPGLENFCSTFEEYR